MKLTPTRRIVTTLVATLAITSACSKEGDNNSGDGDGDSVGDGDGDTGDGDGDGDLPGDGDGDLPGDGDGDMGGTSMGGDGLGGAGGEAPEPESREVCGTVQGMGGAVICADVPEACGDIEDYSGGAWFDQAGNAYEGAPEPNTIMFLLDGDDYGESWDQGSCIVAGEGDDILRITSEGSDSDIYIGGPGADEFRLESSSDAVKLISDFEPGVDVLWPDDKAFYLHGTPADYAAIVSAFDGTDAGSPSEDTRLIYDPSSGYLWADRDGNGTIYPPVHVLTFLNADTITFTVDDFYTGPV